MALVAVVAAKHPIKQGRGKIPLMAIFQCNSKVLNFSSLEANFVYANTYGPLKVSRFAHVVLMSVETSNLSTVIDAINLAEQARCSARAVPVAEPSMQSQCRVSP
jgi:hypothetical protein